MTTLLHISTSPRGAVSASNQAAEIFLKALPDGVTTRHIDLAEREMPEVTLHLTNAKQKAFVGAPLTDEEQREWNVIVAMVDEFKAADHYLIAVPMWNFTIPYRLKQYIDLITHPGLTFTRDENGPRGLVDGGVTYIYSRGGNYGPKDGKPDPFDFQSTYMSAWSSMVGLSPVQEVLVQGTMAGPEGVANAVAGATDQLQALAAAIA